MIEFYKIYLVDNTKNSVMIITEATKQKGRDKHGAGGKSEKPGNGNGRHLLREIAGLYVLIPAGETDAPQNRITALNETGRFLWMQFQHPCTVAEAAAAAEAQYTGQPAEMLRGIENFVRAGLRAGLLREASAAEKTEGKAV